MRLALIEDLKVKNIIVADELLGGYVDVTGVPCGIGWTDNQDGTFTPPSNIQSTGEASAAVFGELLPDTVLLELYDIRNNTNEPQAKRAAVGRVLIQMASGVTFDPFAQKFETLLTQMVTHTSLTQAQANEIRDTLRK